MMKKRYMPPQVKVYTLQTGHRLLASSSDPQYNNPYEQKENW